jgi:hypothetical protein
MVLIRKLTAAQNARERKRLLKQVNAKSIEELRTKPILTILESGVLMRLEGLVWIAYGDNKLDEAADLLSNPLVWSADMDQIRHHLAEMLRAIADSRDPEPYANDLAETLLNEFHNEIGIG